MTRFSSRPSVGRRGRRPLSTAVLVLAAAVAIAGVSATPRPQDEAPSTEDDSEWASTAVSMAWSTDAPSSTSWPTTSRPAAAATSSAASDEKSSWATWDNLKYLLISVPVLVVAIILTKLRNCICGKPAPKHNIPMGYAGGTAYGGYTGGTAYGGYAHEQEHYQQQQDWEWQQQQQRQHWEWEQQQMHQQQQQHNHW